MAKNVRNEGLPGNVWNSRGQRNTGNTLFQPERRKIRTLSFCRLKQALRKPPLPRECPSSVGGFPEKKEDFQSGCKKLRYKEVLRRASYFKKKFSCIKVLRKRTCAMRKLYGFSQIYNMANKVLYPLREKKVTLIFFWR